MDFGSERFDRARDDFESAWRAGRRPRIEDFLVRAPEPSRPTLLRALIAAEVDFRQQSGERPTADDYIVRFSTEHEAEVVRTLFNGGEGDPGGSAPAPPPAPDPAGPGTSGASSAGLTETQSIDRWIDSDSDRDIPDVVDPEVPARIGPYHSFRFLGEGGFGRVYYSRHDDLDRPVAIKVARRGAIGSHDREEALLGEARLAAGLKHPAIVTVYDVGRLEGDRPYVVLEYIEGRSLTALLSAGRLPYEQLARILARVADAAHHAHQAGLVHRDLTPSNILIDARGEPHVTDFGLAVDEDLQRLRTGQIAGTPAYMAPEQVRGETHRLDGRTDVWAIGVTLYQGLTGRLPFGGRTRGDVFDEILQRDPKPPRQVDDRVPRDLDRICLACLARRMTDRYSSAVNLAEDLRAWLDSATTATATATATRPAVGSRPGSGSHPPAIAIVPKGLRAFDEEDVDFFLDLLPGARGRDGLPETVRFWKSRIEDRDGGRAFSVGLLYGPSGGGKSSLVKAGLLPRLDATVRPVFVEASPGRTEAQLSAALVRAFPGLPEGSGAAEALASIRAGGAAPPGVKVLLVIDQFEQWLHSYPDDSRDGLVAALRQCDGRRLQALLLVRDDFWMAITRLFKAIEVPLVEGGNSAPVELFDAEHARRVLVEFGRSCGRLSDAPGGHGSEADRFLDQAVAAMTGPDGRVMPVRLSLFAEVVRHRPWAPSTLRDLGGVDGIGVTFLEHAFDSSTAPPSYRLHRKAALSVLQALLPAPGSVLRGVLRPGRALIESAGYADRPGDFADLMRILDNELRMVTPVDPDAPDGGDAGPRLDRGEAYYQLAHDYLIGPIRHWAQRKQQATRSGRARLRLAVITACWADRPSSHRLPSPLEWAGILWHTRPRSWSPGERRMMRAATRHHLTRLAAVLVATAAIGFTVKDIRDGDRAAAALEGALVADFRSLPGLIPELASHRDRLRDDLERLEGDPSADGRARNVAVLLLYRDRPTPGRAEALRARLPDAVADEVSLIRGALAAHPSVAGVAALRRGLLDESGDSAARLRVACVLAGLDRVDAATWGPAVVPLTQALLAEDRRTVPRWLELLGPAATLLVPELDRACGDEDRDPIARSTAAEALAETLTDRGDVAGLARAVVRARPEASLILLRGIVQHGNRGPALAYLRRVLAGPTGAGDRETGPEDDALIGRRVMATIAMAVLDEPDELRSALRHRTDPGLRTRALHEVATLGLAPRLFRDRLASTDLDPAERQAILLAWAESAPGATSTAVRADVLNSARTLFLDDHDPGVHSAAGLLMRRWGIAEPPAEPDEPSQQSTAAGGGDGAQAKTKAVGDGARRWRRGPNGHTLVILRGPLEFRMGSPDDEADRGPFENLHHRRIDRSIEVATMEVTVEQFRAYKPDYRPDARYGNDPGCPASGISWYEALGYCNWLSERAGIERDRWCYPARRGPGMTIADDAFDRDGFRLPTEAEWEYFCRAGTETGRPFGASEDFLGRYAWTVLNSRGKLAPSGRLLPNEFGLFDTLGSLWEWCHDGATGSNYFPPYPVGTRERPAPDTFGGMPANRNDWRIVRGGVFDNSPTIARSAHRAIVGAAASRMATGLRVVRTIP